MSERIKPEEIFEGSINLGIVISHVKASQHITRELVIPQVGHMGSIFDLEIFESITRSDQLAILAFGAFALVQYDQPVSEVVVRARIVDNECGLPPLFPVGAYTLQDCLELLENESVNDEVVYIIVNSPGKLNFKGQV